MKEAKCGVSSMKIADDWNFSGLKTDFVNDSMSRGDQPFIPRQIDCFLNWGNPQLIVESPSSEVLEPKITWGPALNGLMVVIPNHWTPYSEV